ncbi:hypothetical protein WCLP8_4930005 [uncultured Gammaproteobacteria bacterium]
MPYVASSRRGVGIDPKTTSAADIRAALDKAGRGDAGPGGMFQGESGTSIVSALHEIASGADEATVSGLRPDLAQYGGTTDVSFIWGDSKKGILHIGSKRGLGTVIRVIRAVELGNVTKFIEAKKTIHVEHDGAEAVLSLDEHGSKKTWLLTGWEIGKPDARGEVGTHSTAMQGTPTFSRDALGAGLRDIISLNNGPVTGKIGGSDLLQSAPAGARGSFRVEDGRAIISLFAKADASTFLHETGHKWLFDLIADGERPGAPQALRARSRA